MKAVGDGEGMKENFQIGLVLETNRLKKEQVPIVSKRRETLRLCKQDVVKNPRPVKRLLRSRGEEKHGSTGKW